MRTAIYFVALAIADVLITCPEGMGLFLLLFLFIFLGMDIYALRGRKKKE